MKYIAFLIFLSASSIFPLYVRVLLDEKKAETGMIWTLSGKEHFTVSDLKDQNRRQVVACSKLLIGLQDDVLTINNKRLISSYIKVDPTQGEINHNGRRYKGSFFIVNDGSRVQLINRVELEDYVDAGVHWELLPQWNSSALEAGAIAYRTYVARVLYDARAKGKRPVKEKWFDVHCTPVHQVYKGTHNCRAIHEAVKKTTGLIVTYNKEPIVALYDACCGGVIPSQLSNVNFDHAPYLARGYPCTYCQKCKFFMWSRSYSCREITHLCGMHGAISDVKVNHDRAGAAKKVSFKIRDSWFDFTPAQMMHHIKDIKSSTFSIAKHGNKIQIKGRGFGHQVGFCQWGAQGLALKGWDYAQILRFYYPGTTLMKIEGTHCLVTKDTL